MKPQNSTNLKEFLASQMAQIDAAHLPHKSYEEHYLELMQWRDFDLLQYWLTYNGVFDGGEDMLNHLKILIADYPTLNPRSLVHSSNI